MSYDNCSASCANCLHDTPDMLDEISNIEDADNVNDKRTMVKFKTGVKYRPVEFKKLNQCVQCGLACNIKKGENCENCVKLNLKKCSVCEILLRDGLFTFYSYDTHESHRNMEFKISTSIIIEFSYRTEKHHKSSIDGLCVDCILWQTRVKHKCICCDSRFMNTEENYKLNGNMCDFCSLYYEVTYDRKINGTIA